MKDEAAHDVHACVQDLLGVLFSFLRYVLDACKAAIVIVVVPMECPSISAEGKRESLRILSELLCSQGHALRRDGVCDVTLFRLPSKEARLAGFAALQKLLVFSRDDQSR